MALGNLELDIGCCLACYVIRIHASRIYDMSLGRYSTVEK